MKTQAAIPILAVFSFRSLIVILTYSQIGLTSNQTCPQDSKRKFTDFGAFYSVLDRRKPLLLHEILCLIVFVTKS
ncbi:hypothetical protein HHI36_015234 [Cryptolaemus montrouzieri]|uniref:Secreted protein n=1 Tax=Cryptolaemus montrouzieri TaxID=559131 RepID=A0ABD2N6H3_9CUCU